MFLQYLLDSLGEFIEVAGTAFTVNLVAAEHPWRAGFTASGTTVEAEGQATAAVCTVYDTGERIDRIQIPPCAWLAGDSFLNSLKYFMVDHARLPSLCDQIFFLPGPGGLDMAVYDDLLCGAVPPDYLLVIMLIPQDPQDTVIRPVLSAGRWFSDAVQIFGDSIRGHIF